MSRISSRRVAVVCASLSVIAGGCGSSESSGGASTPEDAVTSFLRTWSSARPAAGDSSSRAREQVKALWEQACDGVDPEIRPGLRFDAGDAGADRKAGCGAVVVTAVAYTGDTGRMAAPSKIAGTPQAADTDGDESIVTVAMRYSVDPTRVATAPAPPASARINVLVVRRDGAWYIATPQAFNPLHARDGGLSAAELRAEHRRLLDAAHG